MLVAAAGSTAAMGEGEEELYTFTIITLPAAASIRWLHHRMPAILSSPEQVDAWMDTAHVSSLQALNLLTA